MEHSAWIGRTVNEKAIDRVDWEYTDEGFEETGIDWKDRNLIANFYLK